MFRLVILAIVTVFIIKKETMDLRIPTALIGFCKIIVLLDNIAICEPVDLITL